MPQDGNRLRHILCDVPIWRQSSCNYDAKSCECLAGGRRLNAAAGLRHGQSRLRSSWIDRNFVREQTFSDQPDRSFVSFHQVLEQLNKRLTPSEPEVAYRIAPFALTADAARMRFRCSVRRTTGVHPLGAQVMSGTASARNLNMNLVFLRIATSCLGVVLYPSRTSHAQSLFRNSSWIAQSSHSHLHGAAHPHTCR